MEPRRLPTPVLVGMVAACLVAGWLWWEAAAPPAGAGAGGGPLGSRPESVVASELEVWMERAPHTIEEPAVEEPAVIATPAPARPGLAPRAVELPVSETVEWLLPPAPDAVFHNGILLGPDAEWSVDGPGIDGGFELQVACSGSGIVATRIRADDATQQLAVPCGQDVVTVHLELGAGYAGFSFRASPDGDNMLVLAYQLVPASP